MKKLASALIAITIASCENDSKEKIINDNNGIIYELSHLEPNINNDGLEYYISFRVSDPSERVIFAGGDSLYLEEFYPDGQYLIEVKLGYIRDYDSLDRKIRYQVDFKGIDKQRTYSFRDGFNVGDTVGVKKSLVKVTKRGDSYKIDR